MHFTYAKGGAAAKLMLVRRRSSVSTILVLLTYVRSVCVGWTGDETQEQHYAGTLETS